MKEHIKKIINIYFELIISLLIICSIIGFFVFVVNEHQEHEKNTMYEFEIIEKYEKLDSRFLSGSKTEYRVIYRDRRLYKGEPDSDWRTYDISVCYMQYRNIQNGYHFKGKYGYLYKYEFN